MSYLVGYNYDVFVSYSMSSDDLLLDEKPWVSRFHDLLKGVVVQKLTESGKDINLFYARRSQGGDDIKACLTEVRQSAVLLIIGSPRWICDTWPQDELQAFLDEFGDAAGRIFIAEIEPPPEGHRYPDAIKDRIRIEFWRRTDRDNPATMSESAGMFRDQLADLASPIARKLTELKKIPVKPLPQPNPTFRRVLLAQPTDDLAEQVQGLESALRQLQIPVLRVPDSQPLDASFEPNFTSLLDEADIVVQLLSPHVGLRTGDLPNGRQSAQWDLARKREGKVLMQWRALDLDTGAIADADHRALLSGDKVQESRLEDFEAEIVRIATRPPDLPVPNGHGGSIFVIYDEIDRERARELIREIIGRGRGYTQPTHGRDTQKTWRWNYKNATTLVILHERSEPEWVGAQMRFCQGATAKVQAPQAKILWLGPPPKMVEDLPVGDPSFAVVNGRDGNLDPLFRQLF